MNDVITQEDVQKESQTYAVKAQELALAVKDKESYVAAAEFLVAVKGFRKRVEDAFGPMVKATHTAWKAACDLRKTADAPLDKAETILQPALDKFRREQERIRAEKEAKLQAEARKRAEDERLAAAIEADKNGKSEEAEALIQAPVQTPVVVLPKQTVKIEGSKIRRNYKFRVKNAAIVPNEYKIVDEVRVGSVVRAMKEQTNIPGIEVFWEEVITG